MSTEAPRPHFPLSSPGPCVSKGPDSHWSPMVSDQRFRGRFPYITTPLLHPLNPPPQADGPLNTGKVAGRPHHTFFPRMEDYMEGSLLTPSQPLLCHGWTGLGGWSKGTAAQSWPPEVPELWDREQTLVHDGDDKKNPAREGALCFIWLSPSPTSPPQKVAPLLCPPHTNQAILCSPTLHIQLVILLSLLAPELQSDASPGPGLLILPWMVAQPLPWAPHPVPTQSQWFFNCHFPAQHCPPELLLALGSTLPPKPDAPSGPWDLP